MLKKKIIIEIAEWPFRLLMSAIDVLMRPIQKRVGINGMPYIFLLPNLLFFGLFVIIPLGINLIFSFTGGTELYVENRPFVGDKQYQFIFDCENYFIPNSCNEDLFWRGVYNTITFVFFQVGFMIIFSLITALILNKKIIGRSFFRSVFFFQYCFHQLLLG